MKRIKSNVLGDTDGDGRVTNNDAELVVQHIVGYVTLTPEQLDRADVNGDGRVSSTDAVLIAQYAAGQITEFPRKDGEVLCVGCASSVASAMSSRKKSSKLLKANRYGDSG